MNEENCKKALEAYKAILLAIHDLEESLDVSINLPDVIWVKGQAFGRDDMIRYIAESKVIAEKEETA